jgi:cysteine desulfurase
VGRHYLDHASTAPPRPEVADAVRAWLFGPWADPGRVHEEGRHVRAAVEGAREEVAALLSVRPRQIIFTSGGTEAANAAAWGAARAQPGSAIICAEVEHSAVRESSERLAPTIPVAVDRHGRIDPAAVAGALESLAERPPALVHCQWANHEVGTLQPVAEIAELCARAGVPLHVDAAAAAGHVDLDLSELDADLVSVSGHKFGAPPGTGALVVRRGSRVEPFIVGGQQERARRGGLENVPGILGLGAAAATLSANAGTALRREADTARGQIARLVTAALRTAGVSVVGDPDPDHRLPHMVCLGVAGVEAEPVLLGLDRAGIAAHSGSACSSESLEPSPVLAAMGVDPSRSLRLSVGWSTTEDDVTAFAGVFDSVVADLRALSS